MYTRDNMRNQQNIENPLQQFVQLFVFITHTKPDRESEPKQLHLVMAPNICPAVRDKVLFENFLEY
jgi:hypothetical protein